MVLTANNEHKWQSNGCYTFKKTKVSHSVTQYLHILQSGCQYQRLHSCMLHIRNQWRQVHLKQATTNLSLLSPSWIYSCIHHAATNQPRVLSWHFTLNKISFKNESFFHTTHEDICPFLCCYINTVYLFTSIFQF